jgi:hypothetical protein
MHVYLHTCKQALLFINKVLASQEKKEKEERKCSGLSGEIHLLQISFVLGTFSQASSQAV